MTSAQSNKMESWCVSMEVTDETEHESVQPAKLTRLEQSQLSTIGILNILSDSQILIWFYFEEVMLTVNVTSTELQLCKV